MKQRVDAGCDSAEKNPQLLRSDSRFKVQNSKLSEAKPEAESPIVIGTENDSFWS